MRRILNFNNFHLKLCFPFLNGLVKLNKFISDRYQVKAISFMLTLSILVNVDHKLFLNELPLLNNSLSFCLSCLIILTSVAHFSSSSWYIVKTDSKWFYYAFWTCFTISFKTIIILLIIMVSFFVKDLKMPWWAK